MALNEKSKNYVLAAQMRDWSLLRPVLRWAFEGKVLAENRFLPATIEPDIPVYYIHQGSLKIETTSRRMEVPAGNWVIITQKLRSREFSKDAKIISIRFDLKRPDGRSYFWDMLPIVIADADYPELREKANGLLECVQKVLPAVQANLPEELSNLDGYLFIQEQFYSWMRCLVGIYRKFDQLRSLYAGIDDRTQAALRFLDSQPLDVEMREATIAEVAGLSISQLNRVFIKDVGETPKQYWEHRKLDAALSLLSSSMTPVKQLAIDLGFKSQNYFARWFRARTEQTPREYREAHSQSWRNPDH